MKKILCVFGTRPEAIKMAPVIKQLQIANCKLQVKVCITAQHRHLLDDVLETFNIKPDYDLNIMIEEQTLFHITTETLRRMESILKKEKPDLVLVHGDTTTTLAASIASFYRRIPVGHVEAGLRTYDKFNPYPEEINRTLTDKISDLLFAPTKRAKENLIKENISPKKIFVTGNSVIDALYMALKKKHKFKNSALKKIFNFRLPTSDFRLLLVTAHRRENFGKPLENVCRALKKIVESHPNVKIIYPVHPNPRVKNTVEKILSSTRNIYLTPPLNYLDFVNLMKKAYIVLTDSGGLQEESPSLGKPVLVMRKITERPEAVISGTVRVVGTNKDKIFKEVSRLILDKKFYQKMSRSINPYGDGKASERIVDGISWFFGIKKEKPEEFKHGR